MAEVDVILTLGNKLQTEMVTAGNAGTAVAVARGKKFVVSIDRLCYLKQGASTVTAAATDFLMPTAGERVFRNDGSFTHISIFAPAGTNAITSVYELNN